MGLKWTDTAGTTPAIQVYDSIEADGGLGYLSDDLIAANQLLHGRNAITLIDVATGNPATSISGSGTFLLPTSFFADLSETQPMIRLLFEGCSQGKGQLRLVLLKPGSGGAFAEIGDGPGVWLDLKKIGDMYEQWSVGNGNGTAPDAIAGRVASETGNGPAFSYTAGSPEEQKYILFVHGWNMEKWEKERFAETAYKRLWWQGYKGRFGLFTWPTTHGFGGGGSGVWGTLKTINGGVNDGTNFDRGEFSAWRSGAPLRQLMQTLNSAHGGELYVFSHSMGGIVASEALRLQSDANGGQIASVYVASQAALSAHTYDGTLSEAVGSAHAVQWQYDHPSVPGSEQGFGPQTPNIYRNWTAFVLRGSVSSTKAVGTLVNFYNMNDWALAAPAWQYNQLTKPDWPDGTLQPWRYSYAGDPEAFNDVFEKTEGDFGSNLTPLHLGTRENPQDRYEIMSFAAESRVKAFGATPNLSQGVTNRVDLRLLQGWNTDVGENKAHKWHSGQFRSSIQQQKSYWKTLLGTQGFNILTGTLP